MGHQKVTKELPQDHSKEWQGHLRVMVGLPQGYRNEVTGKFYHKAPAVVLPDGLIKVTARFCLQWVPAEGDHLRSLNLAQGSLHWVATEMLPQRGHSQGQDSFSEVYSNVEVGSLEQHMFGAIKATDTAISCSVLTE